MTAGQTDININDNGEQRQTQQDETDKGLGQGDKKRERQTGRKYKTARRHTFVDKVSLKLVVKGGQEQRDRRQESRQTDTQAQEVGPIQRKTGCRWTARNKGLGD